MNCDIIRDLIPLYIDECCSQESKKAVKEHLKECSECRLLTEEMRSSANIVTMPDSPKEFKKLGTLTAAMLQSVLLFISFATITLGVKLESGTPSGLMNGFWAFNLVIPTTGFMLSLANWYFVKLYKSKRSFSNCSLFATVSITLCAYIWANFHYDTDIFELFFESTPAQVFDILQASLMLNGIGIILTIVFCILSKVLSGKYADMLGKE